MRAADSRWVCFAYPVVVCDWSVLRLSGRCLVIDNVLAMSAVFLCNKLYSCMVFLAFWLVLHWVHGLIERSLGD